MEPDAEAPMNIYRLITARSPNRCQPAFANSNAA
jgi:hypothetical protein